MSGEKKTDVEQKYAIRPMETFLSDTCKSAQDFPRKENLVKIHP